MIDVSNIEFNRIKSDFENLKTIFDALKEGFFFMSPDFKVKFFNKNFYKEFDVNVDDSNFDEWRNLMHPQDQIKMQKRVESHIDKLEDLVVSQFRVKNKLGQYIWIQGVGKNFYDEDGNLKFMMGCHTDITERKIKEDGLTYLAYHDKLTGLYNRNKIVEVLEDLIHNKERGYFIYIDLINFRLINDSMGHDIGDRLLMAVSRNITEIVENKCYLARNYGDEFMMVTKFSNVESLDMLVESVESAICKPIKINDKTIELKSRIGIFEIHENCGSFLEIIRKTQSVITMMKKDGTKGTNIYNDATYKSHLRNIEIGRIIMKAIENHEFYLNFQPIFNIKTKVVEGFESLIRWESKELGNVSPNEFIPIAEQSLAINQLGDFVMEEACKFVTELNKIGVNSFVSVNVSPIQLHQVDFVDKFLKIIDLNNVKKDQLILEITESVTLESGHDAISKLKEINSHGVGLAIDDFGTGYSSINSILTLPISHLKIDRSIISGVCTNDDVKHLIEMLIAFSHKAKYKIVAEGIENDNILSKIMSLKGDYGQGYLFCRPIQREDILVKIKNGEIQCR